MSEEFNLEPAEADAFWSWMKQSGAAKELSAILQPQVGRNEPCPCQSGLKFKKCCGGPLGPDPIRSDCFPTEQERAGYIPFE